MQPFPARTPAVAAFSFENNRDQGVWAHEVWRHGPEEGTQSWPQRLRPTASYNPWENGQYSQYQGVQDSDSELSSLPSEAADLLSGVTGAREATLHIMNPPTMDDTPAYDEEDRNGQADAWRNVQLAQKFRADLLRQLDNSKKTTAELIRVFTKESKELVVTYEGVIDDFVKFAAFFAQIMGMLNKTGGSLEVRSLIKDRGLRTHQIVDVIVATRMGDPIKGQSQTWLKDTRSTGMKVNLKAFLRWLASKVVHSQVAFEEITNFASIKQRQAETSRAYQLRFMATAKSLKCFGKAQFEPGQQTLFNTFISGLKEDLRLMVLPRMESPDGEGGPIATLLNCGNLNRSGLVYMWSVIMKVIYTMEKVLADEAARVVKLVAASRRNSSWQSERTSRDRDNESGRTHSQRSPSPGARLYRSEVLGKEIEAALNAFQTAPRRDARSTTAKPTTSSPSGERMKDARNSVGPRGSSTPPHSRPFVPRGNSDRGRSPRRGPPSEQNRCNYCQSSLHFWRNCDKRIEDEKSGKVDAGKMMVIWALEARGEGQDDDGQRDGEPSDAESEQRDASEGDSGADSSGGDSSEWGEDREH